MYGTNDNSWTVKNGYYNSSGLSKNDESAQATRYNHYKQSSRSQSLIRNEDYLRHVSNFNLPPLNDSMSHFNVMGHQQKTGRSETWSTAMHQIQDTYESAYLRSSHWKNAENNSNVQMQYLNRNSRNYFNEYEATFSRLSNNYYNYHNFNNNQRAQNIQSTDSVRPKIRVKDVYSLNKSFIEKERGNHILETHRREESNCSLDYVLNYTTNSKRRENYLLQRALENNISPAQRNLNNFGSEQHKTLSENKIQDLMNIFVEPPVNYNMLGRFENHKRSNPPFKVQTLKPKENFNNVPKKNNERVVEHMVNKGSNENRSCLENFSQNSVPNELNNESITLSSLLNSNYMAFHENFGEQRTGANKNEVTNVSANQFDHSNTPCSLSSSISLANNQPTFNIPISNTISTDYTQVKNVNFVYNNNISEVEQRIPIKSCDFPAKSEVSSIVSNLTKQESFENTKQTSETVSDAPNLKVCEINNLPNCKKLPKENEPQTEQQNLSQLEENKIEMLLGERLTNIGGGNDDNDGNGDENNKDDENVDTDNDPPGLNDTIEIHEQKPILLQRSQSPTVYPKLQKSAADSKSQICMTDGDSKESLFPLKKLEMKNKIVLSSQENKINALDYSVTSHNDVEDASAREAPLVTDKYENKINREKLDLLIEFLESDGKSMANICKTKEKDDLFLDSKTGGLKRKREDCVLNQRRRKLNKKSVVKNKNNTREMVSLVSHKTPRTESIKYTTNVDSQHEFPLKENSLQTQSDKDYKDTGDINSENNQGSVLKEENKTSENKKFTKNSPKRNLSKENIEKKSKNNKTESINSSPKNEIKLSKTPIKKEIDLKNASNKTETPKKSVISSPKSMETSSEEYSIINTMRAFQKLQYHYCMGCDLNSSNDSFWINVVSGELRCLNCFKKTAIKTKKESSSLESTSDSIKHHKSKPEQDTKKKEKEKPLSGSSCKSKKEVLFKEGEPILKSSEEQTEKDMKFISPEKEKKKSEVKPKKSSVDRETVIKEKEKCTDKDETKKAHFEKEESEKCVETYQTYQSTKKLISNPNKRKITVENENGNDENFQKKLQKNVTEKYVHCKVSQEKCKKQKEESVKDKNKTEHSKNLEGRIRQEVSQKSSKEKAKHPGQLTKDRNKVSGKKKGEETTATRKMLDKKVSKSTMNQADESTHLLAQLHEKTKKLSWSLFGET